MPRRLPPETWDVHDLVMEEENGLVRVFPLRPGVSSQEIFNVRLDRSSVLDRWPPAGKAQDRGQTSTAGAEARCRGWLIELMRSEPNPSRSKAALFDEAKSRFRVAKRAFDRAWIKPSGKRALTNMRGLDPAPEEIKSPH